MELGLPSANRALTFLLGTVVAVAVCRTEVPRRSLRRGSGARAALHPGPLAAKGRGELLQNIRVHVVAHSAFQLPLRFTR